MTDNATVFFSSCQAYGKHKLKDHFDRYGNVLGFPSHFSGSSVLLKPNLISGRGPALGCTNGIFLAACAEWLIDRGARVRIGDSPALGTARQVLTRQGIMPLLERLAVPVVEFKSAKQYDLSHGVTVGIAEEALDCDLFVNLPRIKAHNQMFMTIAVKNLFGIVVGMRKALAHMKNGSSHTKFADLMLDLIELLPPHATICDGIEAMHRQGPVNGDPLALGCLAGSRNPVALDTAVLSALELDHHRCPIWRAAQRRRLDGSDPEKLIYPFLHPDAFHGSGFLAPSDLQPVAFNPFRFLVSSVRRTIAALRA